MQLNAEYVSLGLRGFPAHGRRERASASLTKGSQKSALLGHAALGRGKLLETGISVDMRGAPKCILH